MSTKSGKGGVSKESGGLSLDPELSFVKDTMWRVNVPYRKGKGRGSCLETTCRRTTA